jgi:hypothetical protein
VTRAQNFHIGLVRKVELDSKPRWLSFNHQSIGHSIARSIARFIAHSVAHFIAHSVAHSETPHIALLPPQPFILANPA